MLKEANRWAAAIQATAVQEARNAAVVERGRMLEAARTQVLSSSLFFSSLELSDTQGL